VLRHAGVVGVHANFGPKLCAQVGSVAGVVEIAVGQDDQRQHAGLAAGFGQFILQLAALAGAAAVDQHKVFAGVDEIAIHAAQVERQCQ